MKNVPNGLSSLKKIKDKLDIGKLETTPVDLSRLINVLKNNVIKKTEYNEFVKKCSTIKTTDTSDFVQKADCNTKIGEIE